jgi:hypothetical protein
VSDIFAALKGSGVHPNTVALKRELELRRERWDRPGYFYRGVGDLMLQHGTFFVGRELPDRWMSHLGTPNECFLNALAAAQAEPDLRYFEGLYAAHGNYTPHAWCVDPDGGVVEVTWPTHNIERYHDVNGIPLLPPDRIAYVGVELHPELVEWFMETYQEACLFDRAQYDTDYGRAIGLDMEQDHDFPILKVPYDKDRRTLGSGSATP